MSASIYSCSIIFLSVFLEALPFVLIGTIVSSLIEVFVSRDMIERIGGRGVFSYLLMGLAGMVFPVCECAIVPIVRRLLRKGMPVGLALTFMLSVPIVNPVVLLSTYYAFPGDLFYPLMRGVSGYIIAVVIGLFMNRRISEEAVVGYEEMHHRKISSAFVPLLSLHEGGCECEHCSDLNKRKSVKEVVRSILEHTSTELYTSGRYLILGVFIASLMQVYVPKEALFRVGTHPVLGILVLMFFAFVLSLCSEADAFIAATFRGSFSPVSVLSFMVLGPMIDIKNILMLSGVFGKRVILRLVLAVSGLCFVFMFILGFFAV
ncbi:MAG: permease [Filifactor alocis]|nr:permease [Filifactor alocis]